MKVLMLYVSTNMSRDGRLWYYDEGAASLAASLEAAGHGVAFHMVAPSDGEDDVVAWVEAHRGSREDTLIVFLTSLLFSAYGHDVPDALRPALCLRERTKIVTAMVGLYATLNTEAILAHPGIDLVGRGEMDQALVELCDRMDRRASLAVVANFHGKEDGAAYQNPLRPLVSSVDALPLPRRDLLPREQQANERDGILTIVATRGCALDCKFCSNHVLRRLYDRPAGYVRTKSIDRVIEEVRVARRGDPQIRGVFFHDDIFALDRDWRREFFARWKNEVGLPFGCNLIVEQCTPEFVADLANAGCVQVQVGIESGDDFMRNEVIGKGISEQKIRDFTARFRAADIAVKAFAMMGLPEETPERFLSSVENFAAMDVDMIQIQVWEAHLGSELQERDPETGESSHRHYDPGSDRRAWRLKYRFSRFHHAVAAFRVCREAGTWRARVLAAIMRRGLLFRYTPDLLLQRDWNGRRRRRGSLLGPLVALTGRLGFGSLLDEIARRQASLAAVYRTDLADAPVPDSVHGAGRIDARTDVQLERAAP